MMKDTTISLVSEDSRQSYWAESEVVKATNLPIVDHSRLIADRACIDGLGRKVMVEELRAIAGQARKMAEKSDMKNGHAFRNLMKAIERLNVLASAIETR